jgi:hypothetical protein
MAGLLVPKAAVDVAARQQFFMSSYILYSTLLEHEDCVG